MKTSIQKTMINEQTETGDGEIYAVSLLTMASALLLIGGAIAKMRG